LSVLDFHLGGVTSLRVTPARCCFSGSHPCDTFEESLTSFVPPRRSHLDTSGLRHVRKKLPLGSFLLCPVADLIRVVRLLFRPFYISKNLPFAST